MQTINIEPVSVRKFYFLVVYLILPDICMATSSKEHPNPIRNKTIDVNSARNII